MNDITKLPCAVVRDLLPSYLEGLTEEETTAAVKAHLQSCPACAALYEADRGVEPLTAGKEVDYLKTVRKRGRRKLLLSVVLAVVLVLGGVGAKLFLIGSPADGGSVATMLEPAATGEFLTFSYIATDSAMTIIDVDVKTNNDLIEITGRKVLVSPIHPAENVSFSLNLSAVREIRAFGETIWQEGLTIDAMSRRLAQMDLPFVGEASAMGGLIAGLDLDAPATIELQTAQEPYGLTLHFTSPIEESRRSRVDGAALLCLALVDNLGVVHWDDPSGYEGTLTLEDANTALPALVDGYNSTHSTDWPVPDSVKAYSGDAFSIQQLRALLNL